MRTRFATLAALVILAPLGACSTIREAARGPELAPVGYPSQLAPMDQKILAQVNAPAPATANSLWRTGAREFLGDQRASRVGDILTVNVSVADAAKLSNTTSRARTNSDDANLTNFFGLEKSIAASGMDPGSIVKMGSDTSNVGQGSVDRSESVNVTLATLITQVLPNGNLVIGGHQQMKINNELRDLTVTGIVRLEDITNANTIDLSQIAEARITYGGRGIVSDVQTPRYGSQLFDILMPW